MRRVKQELKVGQIWFETERNWIRKIIDIHWGDRGAIIYYKSVIDEDKYLEDGSFFSQSFCEESSFRAYIAKQNCKLIGANYNQLDEKRLLYEIERLQKSIQRIQFAKNNH